MQPNETYATFLVSSQLCGPEVPTGALPPSTLQMKQWIKIYYAVAVATAVAPAVMMPSLLPSLLPSLPLVPLVQLSLAVL